MMFQYPRWYGFGFYHDLATESYGAWFGVGQIRFRRWAIDICLLKKRLDNGQWYNRIWWTLGR